MNPLRVRNSSGFTLLEMMVGLIIFTIGVVGFSGMVIMMAKGNREARKIDEAATLIQSVMEEMSGIDWALLGTDTAFPADNGFDNALVRTEGPLNRNGETSGDGPFIYYRHVVVCKLADATVGPGSTPKYCGSALGGNNRPDELACTSVPIDAGGREKVVHALVSWTLRSGDCKWKHTDQLAFQ